MNKDYIIKISIKDACNIIDEMIDDKAEELKACKLKRARALSSSGEFVSLSWKISTLDNLFENMRIVRATIETQQDSVYICSYPRTLHDDSIEGIEHLYDFAKLFFEDSFNLDFIDRTGLVASVFIEDKDSKYKDMALTKLSVAYFEDEKRWGIAEEKLKEEDVLMLKPLRVSKSDDPHDCDYTTLIYLNSTDIITVDNFEEDFETRNRKVGPSEDLLASKYAMGIGANYTILHDKYRETFERQHSYELDTLNNSGKTIICKDCNQAFHIDDKELDWYYTKGLQIPKRCQSCRDKKKRLKTNV